MKIIEYIIIKTAIIKLWLKNNLVILMNTNNEEYI